MGILGSKHQHTGFILMRSAIIIVLVALLFFSMSVAAGASGGEHGAKGWVATDWFRVLNFGVLAVGLFFLLRKPLSEALRSRIDGLERSMSKLVAENRVLVAISDTPYVDDESDLSFPEGTPRFAFIKKSDGDQLVAWMRSPTSSGAWKHVWITGSIQACEAALKEIPASVQALKTLEKLSPVHHSVILECIASRNMIPNLLTSRYPVTDIQDCHGTVK